MRWTDLLVTVALESLLDGVAESLPVLAGVRWQGGEMKLLAQLSHKGLQDPCLHTADDHQ